MIEHIIEWSARHRWVVLGGVLILSLWALDSIRKTPLDAIPDLSDPQVIVFSEWMGRSPDLVEDQITYPLVRALQSTPGVGTVRGYSMFGMSFIYAIFAEGTDIYWARTRVLEQMGRVQQQLPEAVVPTLGPDASGVGWIYQYVLEDATQQLNLAELRALQDFTVRPALQGVQGVAEIASLGGFERQYQAIARFGLTVRGVQDFVEAAVGGMPVSTVIDGRARYSVNVRYAADFRADAESLRTLLVPIPTPQLLAFGGGDRSGSGSAGMAASAVRSSRGGWVKWTGAARE